MTDFEDNDDEEKNLMVNAKVVSNYNPVTTDGSQQSWQPFAWLPEAQRPKILNTEPTEITAID